MWTRVELKSKARETMKKGYWKMFLVGLVLSFITGSGGGGGGGRSSGGNLVNINADITNGSTDIVSELPAFFPFLITGIVGFALIAVLAGLALRIMLGYPLEVGCRRFFMGTTEEKFDLNDMGFSFKSERYWDVIRTMLYRGVLVILWGLLLIIPGIIKAYAYRMVPYILAENPSIGHTRALELSNDMTSGQKMDIFILDLSFIGWYILGGLLFGIGTLFVHPYFYGTHAELYKTLKEQALAENLCTADEFVLNDLMD